MEKKQLLEKLVAYVADRDEPLVPFDKPENADCLRVLDRLVESGQGFVAALNDMFRLLQMLELPEQLEPMFKRYAQEKDKKDVLSDAIDLLGVAGRRLRGHSHAGSTMELVLSVAEEEKEFLKLLGKAFEAYWNSRQE